MTRRFERFAGLAAFLVAAGALLYAALFVAIVEGAGKTTQELWFFTLMLGGLGFALHPVWYGWLGLLLWRGMPPARVSV